MSKGSKIRWAVVIGGWCAATPLLTYATGHNDVALGFATFVA